MYFFCMQPKPILLQPRKLRRELFVGKRTEVHNKVEEHLRSNPNSRIPVDSFAHFLGYPEGTKLTGQERVKVRLALNDIATKLARKRGIVRRAPVGGPVTNPVRNEMFIELLHQIKANPLVEPNPDYFHKKYAERLFPGEKYCVFSETLSQLKLLIKRRLLKENPKIVFWDSNGKPKKRVNSIYVRAGADKKIEEMLRRNPNEQINVNEFMPLLGYPPGTKLREDDRNRIRVALADMARRIAKEMGIKRNPPSGGVRPKHKK